MMKPGLAAALPHIRGGMLRPIAVTGPTRHRLLPDVPTFKELGYPDFDGVQWYGLAGPAKLPADIAAKLNAAVNESLNSPALRERLAGEALETMPMTSAQFAEFIRTDIARWSKLASEHNSKLED